MATGASEHLPGRCADGAYGRVEDRVEVFAAGFDSHVVKPVDPAELAAVIKRLVEIVARQRQGVACTGYFAGVALNRFGFLDGLTQGAARVTASFRRAWSTRSCNW